MGLTLECAKRMAEASARKAAELGVPMAIAILDGGGNVILHHRMDGALLVGLQVSKDKAYTAVAMGLATHELTEAAQPGGRLFGINFLDGCRIVAFGGGLPILEEGVLIGGIGVSGGTPEQDLQCAEAGLQAPGCCQL